MKVHPHPFWLCLSAAALITTVATPARADEMPVNPSIIKVKAEFAKYDSMLECFLRRDGIVAKGAVYAGAREKPPRLREPASGD